MNKIIGYQIESADGKHNIPAQFFSWQIFKRKKKAAEWLANNDGAWMIIPVRKGTIENHSFINHPN